MEITLAGYLIIPLVILANIVNIKFILPLIFLLSVFQGVSVMNIEGNNYYSLSAYHFALLIMATNFIFKMKFNITNSPYIYFIKLLYIFLFWSIIVTICGPILYEGMDVYNPRIGMDDQFNNLSKLSLSSGNLSQIVYISINIFFLAFAIIYAKYSDKKLLINSYIYSGIIVIMFSFWQKIGFITEIYYPSEILYSNLSLEQVRIFNPRLSSTFSEPSLLNGFMVPFLFFI
ncbi:hypothetical protein M2123_000007 [Polynucleobacter sphagniphilus]|nr:hypothetical protein [Polynucleobacter sphagniphilus]